MFSFNKILPLVSWLSIFLFVPISAFADPINLWQDSGSNLYFNSKVGIGPSITSPGSLLVISANSVAAPTSPNANLYIAGGNGSPNNFIMDGFGATSKLILRRADGTMASPTAIQANEAIFNFGGRGYNGSAFGSGNAVQINMNASENWSSTANGTYITFFTTDNGTTSVNSNPALYIGPSNRVGVGTSSPQSALDVNGSVTVEDIKNCAVLGTNASGTLVCTVGASYVYNNSSSSSSSSVDLFYESMSGAVWALVALLSVILSGYVCMFLYNVLRSVV